MNPTVAAGGAATAQGDEVMWFMQARVGVAAKPPVVDTVLAVVNVSPAAHAPVMVAFQYLEACGWRGLFTHVFQHISG